MKRHKKHPIKNEKPETSTSSKQDDYDLTYYIHDRVELMHHVFSILKSKELKALAPVCVRHISIDDLQELCTEELLGISSKRLCAILDGAEPPSDTETSSPSLSPERLETISLDSISSDEEIFSQPNSKKHRKHKHRKSKRHKSSGKNASEGEDGAEGEGQENRASRAGLTVLELLELQARARAIRAHLQQEEAAKCSETPANNCESENDDVVIKEEPAEVVEISSDEDKPKAAPHASTSGDSSTKHSKNRPHNETRTKLVKDLVITIPQSQHTRKIKLKRTKAPAVVNKNTNTETTEDINQNKPENNHEAQKDKAKGKKKKKEKKKSRDGNESDEITLQLSDTEKMDLLEDLDRKAFEKLSSSEDSESSSSDSSDSDSGKKTERIDAVNRERNDSTISRSNLNSNTDVDKVKNHTNEVIKKSNSKEDAVNNKNSSDSELRKNNEKVDSNNSEKANIDLGSSKGVGNLNISKASEAPVATSDLVKEITKADDSIHEEVAQSSSIDNINRENTNDKTSVESKKLSDGELSDRARSEVEAVLKPEIVCISDEETHKTSKKRKKKDKKMKKNKKNKSDFRENCDENFFKENVSEPITDNAKDDDIYEVLELSDDSSCYEVAGTVLSKEPTTEEIEALSAKIDTIEREDVVTDEDIRAHEMAIDNISWKDRYLDSNKVKKVLSTSNLFNALRKKNRDLKKKLEESKKQDVETNETLKEELESNVDDKKNVEEGSIDHYNILQGSTKYVDPVKDLSDKPQSNNESTENMADTITREMKKDAKQLLKMYKKLLKYNDMNKTRDPSKKKKKSKKKSKDSVASEKKCEST